jgi:hypothetical protein
MGKTRRRHVNVPHYEDRSRKAGLNVTMSVYRRVEPNEYISSLQDYVEEILKENRVWSAQRVVLDGLRLNLMPTTQFGRLRSQNSELATIDQAQKCVLRALSDRHEGIADVNATRGAALRGGRNSSAALVFEDKRLIAEQEDIYTALGQERDHIRVPNMPLCVMPRVNLEVATKINQGLSQIAPLIAVALGPVYCDIRTFAQ